MALNSKKNTMKKYLKVFQTIWDKKESTGVVVYQLYKR
jgi:hypothetical protein